MNALTFLVRRPLALACAAALAACGGGGGGQPPATALSPAQASTTPPAQSPSGAPQVPGTRATCGLPDFQAQAMAAINAYRAAGAVCGTHGGLAPAPALSWNAPLAQASLVHSDDMTAANFFSHTGSDGKSGGDRATAAGYIWWTWGENIAAGQTSLRQVMDAWMASEGHCANILNPSFRDIGLACISGATGNTYGTYWTMTLGAAN